MLKKLLFLTGALLLSFNLFAAEKPRVLLKTSLGEIELELEAQKAPVSVANFLAYVDSGHYNNTIFHRVIPNFMIQGGGFTSDGKQKSTLEAIRNEADNGLLNQRGSVAMARTSEVNSATSQFFINVNNNDFLNHGGRDFGYAVFAQVVRGMNVVDRISTTPTGMKGGMQDVPLDTVMILEIIRL
jgi:peptidyl-prolyl cis-trans isomerase A (cyclophilin A)